MTKTTQNRALAKSAASYITQVIERNAKYLKTLKTDDDVSEWFLENKNSLVEGYCGDVMTREDAKALIKSFAYDADVSAFDPPHEEGNPLNLYALAEYLVAGRLETCLLDQTEKFREE